MAVGVGGEFWWITPEKHLTPRDIFVKKRCISWHFLLLEREEFNNIWSIDRQGKHYLTPPPPPQNPTPNPYLINTTLIWTIVSFMMTEGWKSHQDAPWRFLHHPSFQLVWGAFSVPPGGRWQCERQWRDVPASCHPGLSKHSQGLLPLWHPHHHTSPPACAWNGRGMLLHFNLLYRKCYLFTLKRIHISLMLWLCSPVMHLCFSLLTVVWRFMPTTIVLFF